MTRAHPARRSAWPALLGAVLALLGATSLYVWALGGPAPHAPGDWHLVDTHGHAITAHDLRGHILLLYFGYTSCPDICPQTLGTMVAARRLLGTNGARLLPVFVSVDPARDTPAVVGRYVGAFGGGLMGLTGSPAQVDAARAVYGIAANRAGGTIDHSAVLLLIGADGRFIVALPATTSAPELARLVAGVLGRQHFFF